MPGFFALLRRLPSVPVLTSAEAISGSGPTDTLGGPILIRGTNLSGVTGVTVGGTACTSVVAVTDILVTCNAPAKAAGNYDIIATNSSGPSLALAGFYEAWSPLVLNPTAFWDRNYTHNAGLNRGEWAARGGSIAAATLLATSFSAATEPNISALGNPTFVQANLDQLGQLAAWSALIGTNSDCTLLCALVADSISANSATPYLNNGVIMDVSQYCGITLGGTAGAKKAKFCWFDTGAKSAEWDFGTPVFPKRMVIAAKRVATILKITGDGATYISSGVTGALGVASGVPRFGTNSNGSTPYYNGTINCFVAFNSAVSDANISKFYAWAANRYP
jgi:hypothetical protein